MNTIKISSIAKVNLKDPIIYLVDTEKDIQSGPFTDKEKKFIVNQIKNKNGVTLIDGENVRFIIDFPYHKEKYMRHELLRRRGADLEKVINKYKFDVIQIYNLTNEPKALQFLAEGIALSTYEFHKYKQKIFKKFNVLKEIKILNNKKIADHLHIVLDAVNRAKDLVNEPFNVLHSEELAIRFRKLAKDAGFKITILGKKDIQKNKMGGLLAVNKASEFEPTFSIMEWNPKYAKNKKPLILVGKGIVYDTGGYSIKPTPDSMDQMKTDMAGAAAVACTMYAISKMKLPYHVIALVPSTDNVISDEAYVPGDIITMMNGLQVEVLNTDAEGRLILADALYFASRYNPELVIDIATLTGSAMMAVGPYSFAYYTTANEKDNNTFLTSSEEVYERFVQFPLWDDYDELLQSDIADLKNIGGRQGGSISAAKFLQHFVSYPWMHMDIAGMAWRFKQENYRSSGASGFGVRLLIEFILNKCY